MYSGTPDDFFILVADKNSAWIFNCCMHGTCRAYHLLSFYGTNSILLMRANYDPVHCVISLPLSLLGPYILLSSLSLKHALFPYCWNYNEENVCVSFCMLQSASLPRVFHLFRGLGLRHLAVVNDTNEVGSSSVFLNLIMCSWKGKEGI
jgi:hypothetical protein